TGDNVIDLNAGTRSTIDGKAVTVEALGLASGFGGDGNDTLYANNQLDSVLDGGRGNDTLVSGAGSDTLSGGAGIDTAVFAGNRADYGISTNSNGVTTVTSNGVTTIDGHTHDYGIDSLTDIEFLRFADQTIPVDRPPAATGVMATLAAGTEDMVY